MLYHSLLACWLIACCPVIGRQDAKKPDSSALLYFNLMRAVYAHNTAKVSRLLSRGADPSFVSDEPPALVIAIQQRQVDIVRLLLKHGASVKTPRTRDIVHFVLQAPYFLDSKFSYKPGSKEEQTIFKLLNLVLDAGADINAKDSSAETALLYACSISNFEAIRLLLARGASPNTVNDTGLTPLFILTIRRDTQAMKMLIAKGADVHVHTRDGLTLLELLNWGRNREARQILLDAGATK